MHATPKIMARFYLAVCQAVLLYGSDTWVMSQKSLQRLETFHHRCARHIVHRHIRKLSNSSWLYPPSHEVLQICSLMPVSFYIHQRKQHLLHCYAEPCSILYEYCKNSVQHNNSSNHCGGNFNHSRTQLVRGRHTAGTHTNTHTHTDKKLLVLVLCCTYSTPSTSALLRTVYSTIC